MNKVSVIIPVYNVEQYLSKCLDSITTQVYKNLEIIVVDDGSTDNSSGVIKKFQKKDQRIKTIIQENKGLSAARNIGIEIASGDFIMFVDSDDWISTDTIKEAVDLIENQKADLVFWSYIKEYLDKSIPKMLFNEQKVFDKYQSRSLCRRIAGLYQHELRFPEDADSLVTVWGKLYKKELLDNVKFTDTKFVGNEDALFNLEVFQNIKKAVYLNKPFYHYRKNNSNSYTSNYKPKLYEQWKVLFQKMSNVIIENGGEPEFKKALENRISLSIIGLGLNVIGNNNYNISNKIFCIKEILSNSPHREALTSLSLKYFPLHWKVFFYLAKKHNNFGVFAMLWLIKKIK